MDDEFKWDVDSLTRILNSRQKAEWPYEAEYPRVLQHELEIWLKDNCRGEYKIFLCFKRRLVSFKEEEDYTLFLMTWG